MLLLATKIALDSGIFDVCLFVYST